MSLHLLLASLKHSGLAVVLSATGFNHAASPYAVGHPNSEECHDNSAYQAHNKLGGPAIVVHFTFSSVNAISRNTSDRRALLVAF